MPRSPLAVGLAALALGAALIAPTSADGRGAHDGTVATAASGATAVHDYRLITGDTVRVLTRSDGTTTPALLGNVASVRFGGPHAMYAVPRLPGAERRRLDLSLFDTDALAAASRAGRVPVVVRLDPHTAARGIAGLRIDSTHTRTVGRTTVLHATYGQHFSGLQPRDWRQISSIRLARPVARPQVTGPTHQIRVHVRTAHGHASRSAIVLIENVDDADTYYDTVPVDSTGSVLVDVPEGDYSVGAFTFNRVVVFPEVLVDVDTTVNLELGEATVKPRLSFPGHRLVDSVLSVDRSAEAGFTFPISFSGPHFYTRVQPASAKVAHGALTTRIGANLVPSRPHSPTAYDEVVATDDVARGIPDKLTYVHHRRDFVNVVDRLYATGPAGIHRFLINGSDYPGDLFTAHETPVRVPGRLRVLAEAGHYYQQTLAPTSTPQHDSFTWMISLDRFSRAGSTAQVSFDRGPVGPGIERASSAAVFGRVVRRGAGLQGYLPLLSGSGTDMISSLERVKDGSWSLTRGSRTLARGHHDIELDVPLPDADHRYVLTATSHPRSPRLWTLSTRVQDVWTFHSRAGHHDVALLTPSYTPPTTLAGTLPAGPTSFGLGFTSPSSNGDHRILAARVQVSSDDGHTWRTVRLVRVAGERFQVHYVSPAASATRHYLSFRITAHDGHGDHVTETALRAYRLG